MQALGAPHQHADMRAMCIAIQDPLKRPIHRMATLLGEASLREPSCRALTFALRCSSLRSRNGSSRQTPGFSVQALLLQPHQISVVRFATSNTCGNLSQVMLNGSGNENWVESRPTALSWGEQSAKRARAQQHSQLP